MSFCLKKKLVITFLFLSLQNNTYFDNCFLESAYIPCLAHNIQLVIKDGLKLSPEYIKLINHVAKDIVSKSKASLVVAEELRKLHKKLNKRNVTRWNSTLFMIRSVLKLSPEEMRTIRNNMATKTAEQRAVKRKFDLTNVEREMLEELKTLLEMFEFVTDELQSNRINISRVYPCIQYLRRNLKEKDENGHFVVYEYSGSLRDDLLESLNIRFGNLIKEEIFLISTFLDPNFGITYLELEDQQTVKAKIIAMIRREDAKQDAVMNISNANAVSANVKKLDENRSNNYVKFQPPKQLFRDKIEDLIDSYISTIASGDFKQCPLLFWKSHEVKFKSLAEIARKYLGVPASSAAVERIFSISGIYYLQSEPK